MIAVVRGSLIVTDAVTVTDEIGEPPASLSSTQRYSSEPVMYMPFPCPFAYGSSPTDILALMGFCLVVSEGDEPKKKLPPLMVMLPESVFSRSVGPHPFAPDILNEPLTSTLYARQ